MRRRTPDGRRHRRVLARAASTRRHTLGDGSKPPGRSEPHKFLSSGQRIWAILVAVVTATVSALTLIHHFTTPPPRAAQVEAILESAARHGEYPTAELYRDLRADGTDSWVLALGARTLRGTPQVDVYDWLDGRYHEAMAFRPAIVRWGDTPIPRNEITFRIREALPLGVTGRLAVFIDLTIDKHVAIYPLVLSPSTASTGYTLQSVIVDPPDYLPTPTLPLPHVLVPSQDGGAPRFTNFPSRAARTAAMRHVFAEYETPVSLIDSSHRSRVSAYGAYAYDVYTRDNAVDAIAAYSIRYGWRILTSYGERLEPRTHGTLILLEQDDTVTEFPETIALQGWVIAAEPALASRPCTSYASYKGEPLIVVKARWADTLGGLLLRRFRSEFDRKSECSE
jgi:hypothetical protein